MKDQNHMAYRLQSIPNKGFGLVASDDIKPSDLILAEEPLFRVELTEEGDILGMYLPYFSKSVYYLRCSL